jgi:hypothetical protein
MFGKSNYYFWYGKYGKDKADKLQYEWKNSISAGVINYLYDGDIAKREKYLDNLPKKDKYYYEVRKLSERQPLYLLENCENRGKFEYHLDHIIPIIYGFNNNIPSHEMASISNLQFIPWKDNLHKSSTYKETNFER